jgi:hypothetical protein
MYDTKHGKVNINEISIRIIIQESVNISVQDSEQEHQIQQLTAWGHTSCTIRHVFYFTSVWSCHNCNTMYEISLLSLYKVQYVSMKPIAVAARSKAWTVFARSNYGTVDSNHTQCMDVCVRLFCVCIVLCVGWRLATGWSPVQGVLPTVYRVKKLKKRPSFTSAAVVGVGVGVGVDDDVDDDNDDDDDVTMTDRTRECLGSSSCIIKLYKKVGY